MEDSGQGQGPSTERHASDSGEADRVQTEGQEARLEEGSGRGLSNHTQKRIGLHLRAMYDTIVQQPVPDRFRDLIAQLDAAGDVPGPTAD